MLQLISAYIPPESCRILDVDMLVFLDVMYRFSIGWEEQYLLQLDNTGSLAEIPDILIQKIIEDCTREPSRAPYFINRELLPLKYELIDKAQPSDRFIRIESVISKASGYVEKDGNILSFFCPNSIHIYPAEKAHGIQFSLENAVATSSQRQLAGTQLSFFLYIPDGRIIKLQSVYEDPCYTVSFLTFHNTMQYLSLYKENKTPVQIFQYHRNKNDVGLKRLFSKKL